jgi:hypothetical protein
MNVLAGACALALSLGTGAALSQVIEFDSGGLKYQTLTKSSITVMYASLPTQLRSYAIIQVSVSNGSGAPYNIRPEDFTFVRDSLGPLRASSADSVVQMLLKHGGGSDVLKLVSAYETALYGVPNMRSTNGYEQRREAAVMYGPAKVRAAATASAVAFVRTKLIPGESTDGAVFFPTDGKPLGPGRLLVRTNTDSFEFNHQAGPTPAR